MPAYARGNPAHWWKSRSCGYASRAPRATFISPFRRLTSLGILAFLILLFAAAWYATRPARISRMAEALLSNVLGGNVTVQSGHLSLAGTLLLSDVSVQTDPSISGQPLPIFSADQIEARFDWLNLLAGELRAHPAHRHPPHALPGGGPPGRPLELRNDSQEKRGDQTHHHRRLPGRP